MAYHVSKAAFGALVEEALADVPEPFAGYLEEVAIEVRDRPTPKQLKSVGLRRNDLLLGLYHGRPRTVRSVMDDMSLPDVIYLFQEDLEIASDDAESLKEQIRVTVLHEIGHHFGLDEDDLDELGYG